MGKIFIWLSGADRQILDKCTRLPKSEKIRFAGFGTLVLIPAILGLFSMMYAVSTVTNNPFIFITAGIVWFLIVLFIDRFLVSTVYKSTLNTRKNFGVALISRYLFAIFVGIAVSHPLVLLWFNQSISQRISEKRREAVSTRRKDAETQITNLQANNASQELQNKSSYRDCLQRLLTAEQSGYRVQLDCGFSSGIRDCGKRCEKIQQQINQLNKEISQLTTQVTTDSQQTQGQISAINSLADKDIADIEKKFSEDYLARVDALAEMEKDKPHITYVKWFILLLFIFVDILPITMKVTTPMGEYEYNRDTLLFEAQVVQEAEREVIRSNYAGSAYRSTLQAKFNHNAMRDEILTITQVTIDFIKEQEKQSEAFDKQFQEINERISKVKDAEVKQYYQSYLTDMKKIFREAWMKALTQFHAYLQNL
jgi:hypothetical protein